MWIVWVICGSVFSWHEWNWERKTYPRVGDRFFAIAFVYRAVPCLVRFASLEMTAIPTLRRNRGGGVVMRFSYKTYVVYYKWRDLIVT